MNIDEISSRDTVDVRLCCKDWDMVRSTVRLPFDALGEQQHETLGCVVEFPALTHDQWAFLQPELDRMGILYDHLDHAGVDAGWVNKLVSCN